MRPVHGSRDDWKAYAEELERRMQKYEKLYCDYYNAVQAATPVLFQVHCILTMSLMSARLPKDVYAMLGFDKRKRLGPAQAVDAAEELLNEARTLLTLPDSPEVRTTQPRKAAPRVQLRDGVFLVHGSYSYPIEAHRITSPVDLLAWVRHLAHKPWGNRELIVDFIEVVSAAKGFQLRITK